MSTFEPYPEDDTAQDDDQSPDQPANDDQMIGDGDGDERDEDADG